MECLKEAFYEKVCSHYVAKAGRDPHVEHVRAHVDKEYHPVVEGMFVVDVLDRSSSNPRVSKIIIGGSLKAIAGVMKNLELVEAEK